MHPPREHTQGPAAGPGQATHQEHRQTGGQSHGSYVRFFAMIGTSMVVMYALMYLNSYQVLDHAWFSETRLFMALIMGGAMVGVMMGYMLGMYPDAKANVAVFVLGAVLIVAGVVLVRSQWTVDDVDYMEGMIPHHSIAVLTSERAGIKDVRVRELADAITQAQRREIKEMEWLIEDIRANGPATTQSEADARPVPEFEPTQE